MSEVTQISEPSGEVVVYEAPDGGPRVDVVVQGETVWLTLAQMADLIDTTSQNVGTLVGGVILGVSQAIGAQIDPGWQLLAGHIAFLVILAVRPQGLFPMVSG